MMLLYILLALLMLGVLITVHEFGHFASARLCGIPVKEFSIGFGPKLYQRKSKKTEMLFSLRAIPLGGYCMFYGDTDDDPKGIKNDPRNYTLRPAWKRIISVVSGPLMNFVLAFLVSVVLFAVYGGMPDAPVVSEVVPGKPAEAAGLLPGDRIVSIRGISMQEKTAQDAAEAISASANPADASGASEGDPFAITVLRGNETLSLSLAPQWSDADNRYLIGVTLGTLTKPMPAAQILPAAWEQCVTVGGAIADALGKLFTTGEGLNETSGPVGVVQLVAEQTQQNGLFGYLYLAVFISVNLGLMNLLPIPGLDGSRIIFLLIEWIARKPVQQKIESVIHLCGYFFLILLMLFFTFKDVLRIFQ